MLEKGTIDFLRNKCGSLDRRTVVVTGANSGIGLKAAEELVCLGAKVIMACRNVAKASAARETILCDYPDASVEIREMDLSSRDSIRSFVEGIKRDQVDIYGFVNNAGAFKIHGTTAEGEDIIMGTNFTGTRHLVEEILPYLESLPHGVTLTVTGSVSYLIGSSRENVSDLGDIRLYATSKLRLTRYAVERAKSLKASGSNVTMVLTHPGIAITPLANKAFGDRFMKIAAPLASVLIQPTEKSALAIPYVLTNPVKPGSLYGPSGFLTCWGYPAENRLVTSLIF